MAEVGRYIAEFRRLSTRLNSHRIGGEWWKMRQPADVAAGWANAGYLPGEAAPLIAAGETPTTILAKEAR